jgi:hypothetical protein
MRNGKRNSVSINFSAACYRGQRLAFRELKTASMALGEGRGVAPSPAPPSPRVAASLQPRIIPGEKVFSKRKRPIFPGQRETRPGDISNVGRTWTSTFRFLIFANELALWSSRCLLTRPFGVRRCIADMFLGNLGASRQQNGSAGASDGCRPPP